MFKTKERRKCLLNSMGLYGYINIYSERERIGQQTLPILVLSSVCIRKQAGMENVQTDRFKHRQADADKSTDKPMRTNTERHTQTFIVAHKTISLTSVTTPLFEKSS